MIYISIFPGLLTDVWRRPLLTATPFRAAFSRIPSFPTYRAHGYTMVKTNELSMVPKCGPCTLADLPKSHAFTDSLTRRWCSYHVCSYLLVSNHTRPRWQRTLSTRHPNPHAMLLTRHGAQDKFPRLCLHGLLLRAGSRIQRCWLLVKMQWGLWA